MGFEDWDKRAWEDLTQKFSVVLLSDSKKFTEGVVWTTSSLATTFILFFLTLFSVSSSPLILLIVFH